MPISQQPKYTLLSKFLDLIIIMLSLINHRCSYALVMTDCTGSLEIDRHRKIHLTKWNLAIFICHNGAILLATTMHLSENQRAIAYGQLQAGLSPQDVARHFGVHVKTIRRMRTRYMQHQNFKDRPRPGRPTVTTQWEDRYLGMTMARCRFLTGEFP